MSATKPNQNRNRRQTRAMLCLDPLESRQLLTGGVGNTFALLPAVVEEPGAAAEVQFTLDPRQFTRPGGRIMLGVDVTNQQGSTIQPRIQSIEPVRDPVQATEGPQRRAPQPRLPMTRTPFGTAVLTTFGQGRNQPEGPERFRVRVTGQNDTAGELVTGFYLVGDANGDGVVDETDLQLVRQSLGSVVGDPRYNFDADANRDGVINFLDFAYTRMNLGARTHVSPVLTANLDPTPELGAVDRITPNEVVRFTGQATANSPVTFLDIADRAPAVSTVTDAEGNYTLDVPLALGVIIFQVSTSDTFGQEISGQISPVVRQLPGV